MSEVEQLKAEIETLKERLAQSELTRTVVAADLTSIGNLVRMRDDEYPLKAVMRVVTEMSEYQRRDRNGRSIYYCRQCKEPPGHHKMDCSYRSDR